MPIALQPAERRLNGCAPLACHIDDLLAVELGSQHWRCDELTWEKRASYDSSLYRKAHSSGEYVLGDRAGSRLVH